MAIETRFGRYDAADYLVSIEDAAAYLEAAIEGAEGNPSFATIVNVATALGLRLEFHAVA